MRKGWHTHEESAVVAIGGNSPIKDKAHRTVPDRYAAAHETCVHIAGMIEQGWDVAIGKGNGPQVGFILRRSELASHELHKVPLEFRGADTQVSYMLQQSLYDEFQLRRMPKQATTIVTQVLVNRNDPSFQSPSKTVGSFMDEEAQRRRDRGLGRG
jgi:carbamate kinase